MGNFRKMWEWWPLFLAVLGMAAGVGAFQVRVSEMEEQVDANLASVREFDVRVARLEEAITQIPEIRADIKILLRRSK